MLIQSDRHLEEFSNEYKFWEGTWDGTWHIRTEDGFKPIINSIHKVFSTLNGKVLIETAQDTGKIKGDYETLGYSMRYVNQKTGKWVMIQSWPNNQGGNISTLSGKMNHRRIEVFSDVERAGKNLIQKYTFSDISDDYFRWDRRISEDEGKSWSMDLLLHSHRLEKETVGLISGGNLWSYNGGEQAKALNVSTPIEIGSYTGTIYEKDNETKASLDVYHLVGGFGMLFHITYDAEDSKPRQELFYLSFGSRIQSWALVFIDNTDQDHICLKSDGQNLSFKNFETLTKTSHGRDHNYKIEIIQNDGNLNIQFIKDPKTQKNYNFFK